MKKFSYQLLNCSIFTTDVALDSGTSLAVPAVAGLISYSSFAKLLSVPNQRDCLEAYH